MSALEHRLEDLCELVDGYDKPRSHRNRLHALENNDAAIKLAREVIDQTRGQRRVRIGTMRDWMLVAIAVGALRPWEWFGG